MSKITQAEIDAMTPEVFKVYLESVETNVDVNPDFENPYPEDYDNLLAGKVELFSSKNFKKASAWLKKIL